MALSPMVGFWKDRRTASGGDDGLSAHGIAAINHAACKDNVNLYLIGFESDLT